MTHRERDQVREIVAGMTPVTGASFRATLPQISSVLRWDRMLAFLPSRGLDHWELDFIHGAGAWTSSDSTFATSVVESIRVWRSYFDPLRPSPWQRNRALPLSRLSVRRDSPPPMWDALYIPLGLDRLHHARTLVCNGDKLLVWLGGWSTEPVSRGQLSAFTSLVPAIQHRLIHERDIAENAVARAGLAACMEALSRPAVIVRSMRGRVSIEHANSAARDNLQVDRRGFEKAVAAALTSPGMWTEFEVRPLDMIGDCRFLVTRRIQGTPLCGVAGRAGQWWELTPRQGEVLGLLARGMANHTIAQELGCSPRTVEVHVAAILEKSGADSRAQVLVRLGELSRSPPKSG